VGFKGAKVSLLTGVPELLEEELDVFFDGLAATTTGAGAAGGGGATLAGLLSLTGASAFKGLAGAAFFAGADVLADVLAFAGAGFLLTAGLAVFLVTFEDVFFPFTGGLTAFFFGLAATGAGLVFETGLDFPLVTLTTFAGFLTTLVGFLEAADFAGLLFFAGMAVNEVKVS
jgi:hypothetical protein